MDLLHICSLAAMTYVVTGVVVACIRWFHVCHPYDRDPDYYFPGRKAISLFFISSILLLPYVFAPGNPWAWVLVKVFFLPYNLYFLALLLFSYFGSVMQWRQWRRPAIFMGVPTFLMLGLVLVLSLLPQDCLAGTEHALMVARWINIGIGLLMTVMFIFSVRIVFSWVKKFDENEFSNPEDFPVNFAQRVISLLIASIALLWVAAIVDRQWLMALIQLILSILAVGFLIRALHPQRHRPLEEEEEERKPVRKEAAAATTGEKHTYSYNLTEAKTKSIISAIRRTVVRDKAFLNPHLSLQEVAEQCGVNRSYVSQVFKTELGGFFNYVNNLRLDYAEAYQKEHPDAPVHEVASESGFGSRQTYYSVKSRLRPSSR